MHQIYQDRWLRIIPVAFVMYTLAVIDRTNVSLALPSMSRDLHMNPTQAGGAAGAFFWGYLLLQIPGGYLAHTWSAKRFVSILMILWGTCTIATGFVRTWHELWAARFFLGVAQGGVYPATLVLLSNWFTRGERARANAYWMVCFPIAVVVSSPVSGWILGRWDWRVMLVSEGALPLFWLAVWIACIDDYPDRALWLSEAERVHLETTLRRESAALASERNGREPRQSVHLQIVLVMTGVYFLQNCGAYGYLFWLPSALKSAKNLTDLETGFLFSIPFLIAVIAMVLNSRHSDKTGERRGHVALGLAWNGVFLLGSVLTSGHLPVLSFVFVCLAGCGIYAALGPFWAIPAETLPRALVGSTMGFVNAIGNLGGYFGPLVVGYLNKRTGNFTYAFGVLSLGLLVASGTAFLLPARRGILEPEIQWNSK